ncbi:hypothetical protein ACZ90_62995 [Streptomyces albus subsp. albus]|nr:hypothetical protein ACZ90_62995 [Streptomyces albus subsp. albus]
MAEHWHPLAESTDAFLRSARRRYVHSVEIPVPAERLWELLAGDSLVHCTRVFTGLRWLSPRPFGAGTVREVTLLRVLTVRERFFRWEEGRRFTYSVTEASLPGLRRAAEDWIVEPAPRGSRLTWILCAEAHPPAAPVLWACGPLTRLMKSHVMRAIRTHAAHGK